VAGNLADEIMCAKFQGDIFRGYDFTGGRISHFPIDFRMGLTTVQRDCATCDDAVSRKDVPFGGPKNKILHLVRWILVEALQPILL